MLLAPVLELYPIRAYCLLFEQYQEQAGIRLGRRVIEPMDSAAAAPPLLA